MTVSRERMKRCVPDGLPHRALDRDESPSSCPDSVPGLSDLTPSVIDGFLVMSVSRDGCSDIRQSPT